MVFVSTYCFKKIYLSLIISLAFCSYKMSAQSFELMTGTKRLFIDTQYLNFFNNERRVSLFHRARATTVYDAQETDLFTGNYLNYTTHSGFGGTVLGRISSNNSGIDTGIHFFKTTKSFMIYALPSININRELFYSWFSIIRYTAKLYKNTKLYTSLELFSAFNRMGHINSVQRIRIGLDQQTYQYGIAINTNESSYSVTLMNTGVFLRKKF